MSKRCFYCKTHLEDDTDICPKCGKQNDVSKMDNNEFHEYHQFCHRQITKNTDTINSGLTFTVIAIILFVIGGVLTYLAYRYNAYGKRIWDFTSVQFICGVILLAIGAVCIGIGIYKLISGIIRKQKYSRFINELKR